MIERISDLLTPFHEFVRPYIDIGCYKFRRKHVCLILQALTEYDYTGITNDSIVLDLGASVGGFTIHASKRCKHVYAVEPLFTDILRENIALNNVVNCTVIPLAIGDVHKTGDLDFYGMKKKVEFQTFDNLMAMIGEPIDFLKCDIEGAEKYVDFDQFGNIEAELHDFDTNKLRQYHKRNGVEVGYEVITID